jgi:hypothetical protein
MFFSSLLFVVRIGEKVTHKTTDLAPKGTSCEFRNGLNPENGEKLS